VNLAALLARREDDFRNEAAQRLRRLPAAIRVAESLGQALDAKPVEIGDVR
jgi:hypothetical protein